MNAALFLLLFRGGVGSGGEGEVGIAYELLYVLAGQKPKVALSGQDVQVAIAGQEPRRKVLT